jgi:hypothetical protein
MTGTFALQGFGVLSEWNGQIKSPSAQLAMQSIEGTGANSIEIVPRIWTSTPTSNQVISDPTKTESDASLIQGIENAHADGLQVILKPNISTLNGYGSSALAPSDVSAFFASYKTEIVHLATIAQQTGTEVLAIGNEMSSLTGTQYLPYWTDIINSVRAVYTGELTYAAATDEASKVSFWSQLDTIGVNTYPPLTASGTPTVADLVNAWNQVPTNSYWAAAFDHESPVDFLHSLAEEYGKPVLMTEAGYRSMNYGSTITGSWTTTGPMDLQEQADAYAAFLQVWSSRDGSGSWLQGVEFWQWDLNNQFSPTGFSPMGKPALGLITEYFNGVGSIAADNVAALTHDQVLEMSAAGIKTIVATDHDVNVSTSLAADLAAAHISLSEPFGTGAQTLSWNADGSLHDTHYYVVNGQSYSAYDIVYNASGKPASATYSDGSIASWDYNSDGSLHEFTQNNLTGRPWTTTDTIYGSNGKVSTESWHNGATLVQTETWNPDGSTHDIHYFGVTGHDYTEYDVVYGANNQQASATYSNGMSETWNYNADNSLHTITYDGVTNASYTSYTAGYAENRQNVVQEFADANGNEIVRGYAANLMFTSSASGETVTAVGGQSFGFAANAHTTLTGGGDDTFVFKEGFGQVAITNFAPSATSTGSPDQIVFSADMFASVNDVMQHAVQSGANTVITDAHGDSLVLQHMDVAHLTYADIHLI